MYTIGDMKKTSFRFLMLLSIPFLLALSQGDPAPDFALKNQDGKIVHLSDFKGKPVLIYFYPKDETPGCTKEACTLRDQYEKFQKLGAVILGVSRQDEKSHQEFKSKHKLPFDLLVDRDGGAAGKFGVGKMPLIGLIQRKSVLVGPDQKVFRFYDSVNPENHAGQVLSDLALIKK